MLVNKYLFNVNSWTYNFFQLPLLYEETSEYEDEFSSSGNFRIRTCADGDGPSHTGLNLRDNFF